MANRKLHESEILRATIKSLKQILLAFFFFLKIITASFDEMTMKLVSGFGVVMMVQGNFECQGFLLIWIIIQEGPTMLAVGVAGGCLDILSLTRNYLLSTLVILTSVISNNRLSRIENLIPVLT